MRVDVTEVHQLAADIDRNAAAVPAQARTVIKKTGFDTVAAIQQGIVDADAIDTGNMLNTTSVDFTDDGLGFEAGPTAEYALYVDQGTSEIAPRNFTGPAADRTFPQVPAALAAIGSKAIDRRGVGRG